MPEFPQNFNVISSENLPIMLHVFTYQFAHFDAGIIRAPLLVLPFWMEECRFSASWYTAHTLLPFHPSRLVIGVFGKPGCVISAKAANVTIRCNL